MSDPHAPRKIRPKPRSFRGAVLRGLTIALPPILTIVIFLWLAGTTQRYVFEPIEQIVEDALVWQLADIRTPPADQAREQVIAMDGRTYYRLSSGQYVPEEVVDWLRTNQPQAGTPTTGQEVYRLYVTGRYLRPEIVIPVFICVFLLLLYVLGKFLAAEMGGLFDWGILRLPLVRNVYSAVKQVTAFVVGENSPQAGFEAKRVVVIEYPRKGLWSIGLVTGEAVTDISAAANEPCVTVMLPTSPALFTVKPVMVPKSKTHDVRVTIDQALQYIISCGVVMPPAQSAQVAALTAETNPVLQESPLRKNSS
jgi:uncharacterized membrane protein